MRANNHGATPSLAQLFLDEVLETTLERFRRTVARPEPRPARQLGIDLLESRAVLTGVGLELAPSALALDAYSWGGMEDVHLAPQLASIESQSIVQNQIGSITIRINDELLNLVYPSQTVQLTEGDVLQVVSVNYQLANDMDGIIASEGYLSKLGKGNEPSELDYADGRFSDVVEDRSATAGRNSLPGFSGSWTVESGWDRLTITLVNYHGNEASLLDSFHVQLQVGKPDLHVDTSKLERMEKLALPVGQPVNLPAILENLGEGRVHNYAEVDIYHKSDPETIIWAGAVVGNVDQQHSVSARFANTNPDDSFSTNWTPDRPGTYILKIYADPENVSVESNEANNSETIELHVVGGLRKLPGDWPLQISQIEEFVHQDLGTSDNTSTLVAAALPTLGPWVSESANHAGFSTSDNTTHGTQIVLAGSDFVLSLADEPDAGPDFQHQNLSALSERLAESIDCHPNAHVDGETLDGMNATQVVTEFDSHGSLLKRRTTEGKG